MKIIKQNNLNYLEISTLLLIYLILYFNATFLKDNYIAILSAFFGITYTFLAGKGNPICYFFGLSGSGFYSYLAFHNALWGNLFLYLLYYIPMQIAGFFKWRQHLKKRKNEIVKISLSKTEKIYIFFITVLLTLMMILILFITKDKHPIIDGITTVFSVTGMYLTVRRALEQWIVWMIVNGLSAIMWGLIVIKGEKVYSTVIMWSVYFILAIYFYISWKNEISNNQEHHQHVL